MSQTIPSKVIISVGERTIEVSLEDARSFGFLANGAMRELEKMYDGHGNLLRQAEKPCADDLVKFGEASRSAWLTATEEEYHPKNKKV